MLCQLSYGGIFVRGEIIADVIGLSKFCHGISFVAILPFMTHFQQKLGWIIWIGIVLCTLTQCRQSSTTPTPPLFVAPPSPTLPATPTYALAPVMTPIPVATSINLLGSPIPVLTPTTAPSPTPIEYTIQTGDTIWTIAARNGFTIDELLTLNPDIRPESIQIGQIVRLPTLPTPNLPTRIDTTIPINIEAFYQ